MKETESLAV